MEMSENDPLFALRSFLDASYGEADQNNPFDQLGTNLRDLQMRLDTLAMVRAVDPQGELRAFATMMSLKRGSRR